MRAETTKMMTMTTGTLLALGLALAAGGLAGQRAVRPAAQVTAAAPAPEASRAMAPAPWIQEDPGARAYAAAREALNARRYEEAARLFAELRRRYPSSGYVADSYYYEAFARSRDDARTSLQRALELLAEQREKLSQQQVATARDAEQLQVRIEAQLARRGDAQAAEAIARQAAGASTCGPEQEVRLAALGALLNMNAEQALPILKDVLKARDECSAELRKRAVFLISQKLDEESVGILLDLAHRNPDPDPEVREQAVFWLSQVRSEEALKALESILQESGDPKLQERAVFALSQQGSPRAAEILAQVARRPDASRQMREQAIFWIGQNPSAGGVKALLALYPTLNDAELKERAVFAISQTNTAEARQWLLERLRDASETLEVRKMALFWLGQSQGLSLAELQGIYGSLSDPEMKEQAVFVASQRSGPAAVDFLMEVARTEKDPKLRERAIFWLGQSKDPRVAEFLLSLIRR